MTIQQAAQILELTIPFSKEELKKAYREALLIWHPDRFETSPGLRAKAELKTHQINEAYVALSREADLCPQHTNRTDDNQRYQPPSQQASNNRETRQHKSSPPPVFESIPLRGTGPDQDTSEFKAASGSGFLKMFLLPFQLFAPICVAMLFVANEMFGYSIRDLMFLRRGIWGSIGVCFFVLCIGGTFQRFISPRKDYVYTWVSVFFMIISSSLLVEFFRPVR